MNFYSFHVGDYAAHTKHLTPIEDLAYRRMLDLYYTSEKPLPCEPEKVARLIGLRDYMQEVSDVLSDFFVKSEDGHKSKRCDDEISTYRAKAERAKAANSARWKGEKSDSSLKSDADQLPTKNQEPITNNHTSSLRSEEGAKRPKVGKPVDVDDDVWISFLQVRKSKKAAVTDIAILGIRREAVKAGVSLNQALTVCCERGWAGFKSEWMREQPANKQEALEQQNRQVAADWVRRMQGDVHEAE